MDSVLSLPRSIYHSPLTPSRNSIKPNHEFPKFARFIYSPKQNLIVNVSPARCYLRIQPRHGLFKFETLRVKFSSKDAQFNSFHGNNNELEVPSFAEFITSERVKVVAMLALALALCNADRVVMSVAIVPLSLSHGWSRSFSGIVQVVLLALPLGFGILHDILVKNEFLNLEFWNYFEYQKLIFALWLKRL